MSLKVAAVECQDVAHSMHVHRSYNPGVVRPMRTRCTFTKRCHSGKIRSDLSLGFRTGLGSPGIEFVHLDEISGDGAVAWSALEEIQPVAMFEV